ncbi:MAG: hypothetical protein ACI9YM_002135 [Brevundimonas sp.]|jgi:hypothetical protein
MSISNTNIKLMIARSADDARAIINFIHEYAPPAESL